MNLQHKPDDEPDIVITGLGVVSPIGIGLDDFQTSIANRRSGIGLIDRFDVSGMPVRIGGEVSNFDPKQYVRPRKSLKVMSLAIQFGFASAAMAYKDAAIVEETIDPERRSVIYGSDMIYCDLPELKDVFQACMVDAKFDFNQWGKQFLREMRPLWLLKYLPNMPACHIGISLDARGPNNSIVLGDVSSLAAIIEATSVLRRNAADVVITGGVSSRINPSIWAWLQHMMVSQENDNPAAASRPFDAARTGIVFGEGAASLVLERRSDAIARGAKIYGTILGSANTFTMTNGGIPRGPDGVARTIQAVLNSTGLSVDAIGHVNACGLSTLEHDRAEAQAIQQELADVPVTAPKSYFGNLGAASGAIELIVSLLSLQRHKVPATLNYETPDLECPINVVHDAPLPTKNPVFLKLSQDKSGQSVALAVSAEK